MQPNKVEEISIIIENKISHLSPSLSEACIFRVHNQLRNLNDKAYKPETIAIGPYHHIQKDFEMMADHKLRYLQSLLQRKNESVEKYVDAMRTLEPEARKCYAEPLMFDEKQLTEMMLLDGCFVVELFRKYDMIHLREKNDPIFKMDWMVNSLQRDLLLFENQLPFSVLCKLFDLIEVPNNHKRLIFLALKFFRDLFPGRGYKGRVIDGEPQYAIKHLVGLVHNSWCPSSVDEKKNEDAPSGRPSWRFIHSVTELREAGIKFKKAEEGSLFEITFKNGVMQIPPLTIEDRTEAFFRNLIAYEQYGAHNGLNHVSEYMKFMDCLIDTPKDVETLVRHGIIDNWLGEVEVVSAMINKMTDAITGPSEGFRYGEMFARVNIHCNTRRNRWMANLRRNYFKNPWTIISVLAGVALLLLTATQTVFT